MPQKTEVSKEWRVRTVDGLEIAFNPVWRIKEASDGAVNINDKDIECVFADIVLTDKNGNKSTFRMGFQELFMFVYFVANEELRQQLALRYEREVKYIPYDVQLNIRNITDEEKRAGVASRRIELPVDEITMAIARNEALKIKNAKFIFEKGLKK